MIHVHSLKSVSPLIIRLVMFWPSLASTPIGVNQTFGPQDGPLDTFPGHLFKRENFEGEGKCLFSWLQAILFLNSENKVGWLMVDMEIGLLVTLW